MNLSDVKSMTIGGKDVKQLEDTNGNIWWKKSIIEPYTFVSYIESSGTQYIDTGITSITKEFAIEINFSITTSKAYQTLWCCRTHNTDVTRSCFTNALLGFRNDQGTQEYINNALNLNQKYNLKSTKTQFILDNIIIKDNITTTNSAINDKVWLLSSYAVGTSTPGNPFYGKLYSCEIYDNGTLIRNFKPCVRNSDGVIGLLDEVNDVFYTNAGTGTFEKGKEIVNLCDNSHYLKAYIFESQNKISYDENSRLKYAHVPKNTDLYVAKSTPTNRYRIALMNTVPAGEAPIGQVVFNADNKNVLSTIINSGNYEYVAIQYSNSAQDTDIEVYEI